MDLLLEGWFCALCFGNHLLIDQVGEAQLCSQEEAPDPAESRSWAGKLSAAEIHGDLRLEPPLGEHHLHTSVSSCVVEFCHSEVGRD